MLQSRVQSLGAELSLQEGQELCITLKSPLQANLGVALAGTTGSYAQAYSPGRKCIV